MPVGPSHSSHSSGGGSHGGGFSGGGGGWSSGSRSYHPHPRHPITIHWFGRPVVFSTGVQNTLVSLLVIFLFVAFFGVFSIIGYSVNIQEYNKNKQELAVFETDAVYYQNLISKAQASEEGYFITSGTFEGRFYYSYDEDDFAGTGVFEYQVVNGVTYYFINYTYVNDKGQTLKGETYTQFSSSQARAMILDDIGTIEIAYTYDSDEGGYVSINTSYSLEKNQDYNILKKEVEDNKSSNVLLIIGIVLLVVAACIFVGLIFVIRNQIKKSKTQAQVDSAKAEAEIAESKANAEKAEAEANSKNRMCDYCGCSVPDGASKCPSCGSRMFKKKK